MTSSFSILNSSDKELIIRHEPECFEFYLPPNDEVIIVFNSCMDGVLLRQYIDDGKMTVDILDNKSPYRVMRNGIDVFEKYMG